MRPFTDLEKKIATSLHTLKAIQFGEFKLKLHEKHPNAPLSPIYLNLRDSSNPKQGTLTPDFYRMVSLAMIRLAAAKSLKYDLVVGLPNAGTPFAQAFVRLLVGKPEEHLFDLKKEEANGKRRIVSDQSNRGLKGKRCLLIDDLISGADSKLEAKQALEELGATVTDALILVDRCQGGTETMAQHGVRIHAVLTLPDLIAHYAENGFIQPEEELKVLNYLRTQLTTS